MLQPNHTDNKRTFNVESVFVINKTEIGCLVHGLLNFKTNFLSVDDLLPFGASMRLGLPRLRKAGNERGLNPLPKDSENQQKKKTYISIYLQLRLLRIVIDLINLIV